MDTKAAFEKWWKDEHGNLQDTGFIGQTIKMVAQQAWDQSRAAIEIELPEEKRHKHNSYPEARAQDDDFNDALSECSHIITSHGIRIKGNTV